MKKRNNAKKEFSKLAIIALTSLWITSGTVGLILNVVCFILYGELEGLEALYSFIGTPMSCGLVGYFIKAAVENREKIKGSAKEALTDTSFCGGKRAE